MKENIKRLLYVFTTEFVMKTISYWDDFNDGTHAMDRGILVDLRIQRLRHFNEHKLLLSSRRRTRRNGVCVCEREGGCKSEVEEAVLG